MTSLALSAPAKLNLHLRVRGRRDDGFHELETLMVTLPGLADTLEFFPSENFGFTCDDPSIPSDASNLVVRAALAYQAASGQGIRHRLHLGKVIPHGAGLGGGSSDAAATLRGLDRLSPAPLGPAKLWELAAALGSDIPFFLTGGAMICRGRGEILEPAENVPSIPVVLLKPAFGVATPDAYRRWRDSKEVPGILYTAQEAHGLTWFNDLERPVFEKHRFLAEMKQWLLARQETEAALMSGSGATVFAVLRDGSDAAPLIAAARRELDPGLWSWSGLTA